MNGYNPQHPWYYGQYLKKEPYSTFQERFPPSGFPQFPPPGSFFPPGNSQNPSGPQHPPQTGGGQGGSQPLGPPPVHIPYESQGPQLNAVDPGSLRGCLYRYTYIWLRGGRSFWYYPTYIGRSSVAGYRWKPNSRQWTYYGIDANEIRSFECT
ncbi:hypothetical protein ACFVHQ_06970 [Actinomycetes bacterium NPDC127524]